MKVVLVMQSDADLLQIAFTLSPTGGLASLLHCWEQQCDQNCDNRNNNEQLDECESLSFHVRIPSGGHPI